MGASSSPGGVKRSRSCSDWCMFNHPSFIFSSEPGAGVPEPLDRLPAIRCGFQWSPAQSLGSDIMGDDRRVSGGFQNIQPVIQHVVGRGEGGEYLDHLVVSP